jgi:uncharacterized membrane protein YphA (DoxX/SURF4 family)
MMFPHYSAVYEKWAPVFGRMLLAIPFIAGGIYKIPYTQGFAMQAAMTAAAHVPFASLAVFLAFILEIVAGVSLIIGWQVRTVTAILIPYVVLLTILFHSSFASPMDIGLFIDHLVLIGMLFYVSVYGAQNFAVNKD